MKKPFELRALFSFVKLNQQKTTLYTCTLSRYTQTALNRIKGEEGRGGRCWCGDGEGSQSAKLGKRKICYSLIRYDLFHFVMFYCLYLRRYHIALLFVKSIVLTKKSREWILFHRNRDFLHPTLFLAL